MRTSTILFLLLALPQIYAGAAKQVKRVPPVACFREAGVIHSTNTTTPSKTITAVERSIKPVHEQFACGMIQKLCIRSSHSTIHLVEIKKSPLSRNPPASTDRSRWLAASFMAADFYFDSPCVEKKFYYPDVQTVRIPPPYSLD